MITYHDELRENTYLIDKNFPFNVFNCNGYGHNILYLHWHDNIEIIYVTDGHAVFDIGGYSIEAESGDILFVNSGQLHSGYSIDNTNVKFHAIVFGKSFLGSQTPDPYHLKYITPFFMGHYLFPRKIERNSKYYDYIKNSISTIIDEFEKKIPGYEILIKNCIHSLVINIFRYYLPNADKKDIETCENNIANFNALMTHISEFYSKKITIEQAAQIVNLSPYYFCRLFKKMTGRTFVQFLNLYRVNKAEELLRSTNLPITLIAEKVGICNINYFSKIFKQFKRYPPSQCRKADVLAKDDLFDI